MDTSTEEERKAFTEFQDKVRRTILLDNLSPEVTKQMIKATFGQFGNVLNVEFIPNFTIPEDIPQAALVEMESQKQAANLINQMNEWPLLVSSRPRPVRARPAKFTNFADRPRRPGRKVKFTWIRPDNPDFEVCKELKTLAERHACESAALLQYHLEEERKLAKQNEDMLKSNFMKLDMIDKAFEDGILRRLASEYHIKLRDEP